MALFVVSSVSSPATRRRSNEGRRDVELPLLGVAALETRRRPLAFKARLAGSRRHAIVGHAVFSAFPVQLIDQGQHVVAL
jgi:hypothetical protein